MKETRSIPCPRCDYLAFTLLDLEVHGKRAHERTDDRPGHVFGSVDHQEAQPVEARWKTVGIGAGHPALAIPEPDPTFWVEPQVTKFLYAVGARTRRGAIVNVLLVGPTGSGKSSLPREFAANWQRPFFTIHCQLITEQEDWWGTREMSPEQGTYFRKAALVDAVETPACVILLDEANRTHPENLNSLFGFLDHRRSAWIPALHREVAVAPGVAFFVTLNEGLDYVSTNPIDRALRDRISSTVRLDYLPVKMETSLLVKRIGIDLETAGNLVEFARTVRKNPKLGAVISTRQLLECAALVKEGLSPQDAVLFAIVNGAMEDCDRKAMLQSLQVVAGVDEAYVPRRRDEDE
ncbi:MAG: AAA family ATPase [Chloroflexota bacterium]